MFARVLRGSVGRLLLIGLASSCLSTCSRREGLNFDCEWTADPVFEIDLRTKAHVQHLLDDISVAEEMGVRYGDRIAGWRLVDTFGIISRHGGLKNRDAGRLAQQRCTNTLFETIGATHGVTAADIEALRPRLSERGIGHRGRTEALRANFLVMFGIGIVASWIGVATAALRQRADSSPVTPSQPL